MIEGRRANLAGGHVYCRVRHDDVDLDECLRCERLVAIHRDSSPPYLSCDSSGSEAAPTEGAAYAMWWHRHHRRVR